MYEMIHGRPPFTKKREEHIKALYYRIVKKKDLVYCTSMKGADIISKLLRKDASFRLGCLAGGADEIREHEFFESIDFDDLAQKKIRAPYVPGRVDFDKENNDNIGEEEEIEECESILPIQQQMFIGY